MENIHFSLFLSQSRRPRIWRPAVPCPQCDLNDDSFNFCQRCGFRKDPVVVDNTRDLLRIDIKDIEDRISELKKIRSNEPYEKQKSCTHRELVRFLPSLPTPQVSLLCLSWGHLKIPLLEGQVRPDKSPSDVMSTNEPNSILLL